MKGKVSTNKKVMLIAILMELLTIKINSYDIL